MLFCIRLAFTLIILHISLHYVTGDRIFILKPKARWYKKQTVLLIFKVAIMYITFNHLISLGISKEYTTRGKISLFLSHRLIVIQK